MSYFILTQANGAVLSGCKGNRPETSSLTFSENYEDALEMGYLEAINTMHAVRRIGLNLFVAEVYGGGEMWFFAAVPGQIRPPWLADR